MEDGHEQAPRGQKENTFVQTSTQALHFILAPYNQWKGFPRIGRGPTKSLGGVTSNTIGLGTNASERNTEGGKPTATNPGLAFYFSPV